DVYIPNPEHDPQGITLTGNLPLYEGTEVHSADDVPLFASGPGARYFHGIHDNTDIFLGIMNALELDATITAAKP
ncbi:MAG: alkaline phosphatase, partial [Chloroflexi bacterium]|nr:alkaline phosphatase [Chloroflexota bacterium]